MTTSKYTVLNDTRFVSIKGEDKKDFLQGIITNDINKCDEKAIYSCLLTPQGKFLSDFFVIPLKYSFLIEINQIFISDFITKLKLYKLRSKVEIEQVNGLTSFVIIKPSMYKKGSIISSNPYIEYIDPRGMNIGHKIIIKNELAKNFILSNNLQLTNIKDFQKILLENLIPDSTQDLIVNKSLLLENNFDEINALDWEKGCYVGQELTARMKYRSLLKKSLRLVKIDSGKVRPNDNIFLDDKKIGLITSIIEDKGLAMIKIEDANNAIKNKNYLSTTEGQIIIIN